MQISSNMPKDFLPDRIWEEDGFLVAKSGRFEIKSRFTPSNRLHIEYMLKYSLWNALNNTDLKLYENRRHE